MAIAFNRSRDALAKIRRHSGRCLVVHYACQSLYDDRESLSPSISNIVVKDWDNDQTVSFAAHLVAEKMHIAKDDIESRFLEIETKLLEDFYSFVQNHSGDIWLHWNMINIHYGFETLAHRYYVLTGRNAPSIDIDSRINIAAILFGVYGEKYVGIPHMQKLMEVNGGIRRDFVLGKDEVELFRQKEYARLHASTVCKVKFFSDVVELTLDKKLKTTRSTAIVKMERSVDGVTAKSIGLASSAYAIIDIGGKGLSYLAHHGWFTLIGIAASAGT